MNFLKIFALSIGLLLLSNKTYSQCFQIESILVDACDNGADEGLNEMFRMKIGPAPLNTSNLTVTFPAQIWLGVVQNATTAAKVTQLNAYITASGGCGLILEPPGGILPANATVILVTSQNLDVNLNSFSSLASTIYMIFQNNPSRTGGHFANYNPIPGTRTLSVSFGSGCSDSVTYERSNLVDTSGNIGTENGATVNFTPSGTPSYINNGCIAPIAPFTVEAGTSPVTACPGQTINLTGSAQGQTSVSWSATTGSFSNTNTLSTSYTVPTSALSGSTITLTLTATNTCGATLSDQIIINISGSTLTLDSANNTQTVCSGNAITPIQYTFGGGATGVNVTGLPTGVTATTSGNTVTISGTATGDFSYSITTVGGCGSVTLNGSITVSSNATLVLDSANNTQTVCSGNAITPIQYTFGGGATGATVTGLPTGVTATTSGNTVTISGTATGDFSYSITTVGGCGSVTLNGSITVSSNATLVLDSGNNTQTICSGNAIAPIQYTFGGGATGVNVTGLPTGVTTTTSGNTVTISGTAAGDFSYTITTVGGCGSVTLNGSITVSSNATLVLDSANNTQTICSGNAIAPIQYTFGGGATGATVTGLPTGVTATTSGNTVTISGTATGDFSYSITTVGGCGNVTLNGSITVSSNATLVLDSANNTQTVCSGNAIASIQYTFGGGATGATVTGLPTGVTATTSGNTVTISGTAAGDFSYSITTVGGCGNVTLNGGVTLTSGTTPNFNPILPMCTGSTVSPLPNTSLEGITGTWSPAFNNTTTTTYTFTPDNGQCAVSTQLTVTIYPVPVVIASSAMSSFCSGGTTSISLSSNVPNAVFSWTVTGANITGASGGSGNSINQTLDVSPNTTTTVALTYTIFAEANGCVGPATQVQILVSPIPNVNIVHNNLPICSGATTAISFTSSISGTQFNWIVLNAAGVTGATNGSGNEIIQTLTTTGLSSGSVTYQVTPILNGCPGNPELVTVTVNPKPSIFTNSNQPVLCSNQSTAITVSTFEPNTVINWVVQPMGVDGAMDGTYTGTDLLIAQTLTTTGNAAGYVDYYITPSLSGCDGETIVVRINVNPIPEPVLTDGVICVDATGNPFQTFVLDSGLSSATHDFIWYFNNNPIPNSNTATFTADEVGTYGVMATVRSTNCSSEIVTATITSSTPSDGITVEQSNYFSGNATLLVTVTGGTGVLEYQLDNGALQSSNVFTNVSSGLHTITAVDTQGCTYLTYEVYVIEYPQYFTPNGDGYNDTWFIAGLQATDKINIFDRYGKLIKQLQGEESWDGTYNQQQLPSTDYWFTVDYTENGNPKQFKAHFSLKR
ncbi:T9SS type B sorting domain-containing protein [Flavobacterium sp. HXWNR69]|uniref:T9SS type B sorting domain-containing protein n=1 Tax=Flavobacterium fragile TaxID=2949085 RepID=A0ABT0TE31_9FLAO|nr:T9SS type B sorting domain-containing protein [Flavobacterium sp. HXWNR69]MCL9769113.1 T9SS type B sorting domain-containing protein [Flavobacterium sp. HXWNR69]